MIQQQPTSTENHQHGEKLAREGCRHIPSGNMCLCGVNNAECILCGGWYTYVKPPDPTWDEFVKELIQKTLKDVED